MASADFTVVVARPVNEVFAVLTNPTLSPKWSRNAIKGELLTPGPPGVGSRRRAVVKGLFGGTIESVMEVTELEPNRMVALKLISASWGGTGRTKYTFTPVGAATRVDWHWELEPGGWLKPFAGPLMAVIARGFQRDLNNFKAMMEAVEL